jgi:DNA-binding transcriptional regulator YhcF (GntR family)
MNFLRSTAELLAEHLRGAIERGEVANPLPSIRAWSGQLGVSCGTMEAALRILKGEGVVESRPRKGLSIVSLPVAPSRPRSVRLVRWIWPTVQSRDNPGINEEVGAVLQKLSVHGIRLSTEMFNRAAWEALARRGERPDELLMLQSPPRERQEQFRHFRKSVLLIGPPFPGIPLPFVTSDTVSALRHCVFHFVRQGFGKVTLFLNKSGRQPIDESFRQLCAAVPRPIHGEIVRLPDELNEQARAVHRFSARIVPLHGLIAVSPIQAGQLMMAVMHRWLRMPRDAQVVAVNALPTELRSLPIPVHYPFPLEKFCKVVSRAAVRYFETGRVPPLRKMLPLEMVTPS